MVEPIATIYNGAVEEDEPRIEDGKLVGKNIGKDVEVELEEGMVLRPTFATRAGEDVVIEVYDGSEWPTHD